MGIEMNIEEKKKEQGRGKEEEDMDMEMEEQGRWCLERADRCIDKGEFDVALSLLRRAERLYPQARGLPESLAIAHVFHASSPVIHIMEGNDNICPHHPHQHIHKSATNWYKILKVDEKSDVNTIKKSYRQLALLLHPDKNKHGRAEEAFKLVSEAYALLSDKAKRADFDLDLMKRQQKKCSCTSHLHSKMQYKMRSYQESLKERNQTHFHRFHFSSDFHIAEWRLEHEKLRMFRQRAQAKIDSLAQILEDRQSRWSEEMENINWRVRQRCERSSAKNFWRYMEKCDYNKHQTDQLHPCARSRNRLDENGRESALFSEIHQKVSLTKGTRRLSLSEKIRSWKSRESQNPELLQRLDGLLGILKEEIALNGDLTKHTKLRDAMPFGVARENKMNKTSEMHDERFVHHGSDRNDDECFCGNLEDNAYSVIDDFLTRLDSFPNSYQTQAFTPDSNTRNSCRTEYKSSGRNDSSTPHTWTTRKYSGFEALKKHSSHDRDSITTSQPLAATTTLLSHDQRRKPNKSDIEPKENVFPSMESFNTYNIDTEKERNILQNQKKRSEQLLRTLERLREETQSVAATLESMREHMAAESHQMRGIFSNGNCIIAT